MIKARYKKPLSLIPYQIYTLCRLNDLLLLYRGWDDYLPGSLFHKRSDLANYQLNEVYSHFVNIFHSLWLNEFQNKPKNNRFLN